MKRVAYEEMVAQFTRVLEKHGFTPADAKDAAVIFAQNSLSGVYSHGLNRFPRVVSYLEKGEIDPLARAECISRMGSMERWDGHRGFGPLNAQRAMERACALAKENGVGIVALGNNNHWMRGGTYGWLAAEKGCIGICWSNTAPNMPAWGAKDCRIGNNPLILAVPRSDDEIGLTQIMIAIDPTKFGTVDENDAVISAILADIKASTPARPDGEVRWPGEGMLRTIKENRELGVPVVEEIWESVLKM